MEISLVELLFSYSNSYCCDDILLQAILNTHPYHVDSLLQLSEICKMGEDFQMAAELIGGCTL